MMSQAKSFEEIEKETELGSSRKKKFYRVYSNHWKIILTTQNRYKKNEYTVSCELYGVDISISYEGIRALDKL